MKPDHRGLFKATFKDMPFPLSVESEQKKIGIERKIIHLNILKITLGGPVHGTDKILTEIPDKNLSMCTDESMNQEEQRQTIRMHPRAH